MKARLLQQLRISNNPIVISEKKLSQTELKQAITSHVNLYRFFKNVRSSEGSRLAQINLANSENDEIRYQDAIKFIQQNPEREFAKNLMNAMWGPKQSSC